MRLRNTSASHLVMRSRNSRGRKPKQRGCGSGAKRFAPQGYTTRHTGRRYSTTPKSGRISELADALGHTDAINWASAIIDQLMDTQIQTDEFMRTFARSIDLRVAAAGLRPRSFAVDVSAISDLIFEDRTHRFVRKPGDQWLELSQAEVGRSSMPLRNRFQ